MDDEGVRPGGAVVGVGGSQDAGTRAASTVPRETMRVDLGERSYDILISTGCLEELGGALRERGIGKDHAMVFTDPRIGRLYFRRVRDSLLKAGFTRVVRHDIPEGERNKSFRSFEACSTALATGFPEEAKVVPVVITLGGGIVGDVGGMAACTFRRGVPCVHVPTTLLAQVDCSVGGKVGFNHAGVKNQIGQFYQPSLVFIDMALLKTLDPRQLRSGMAEVIKYGAVCDADLFETLDRDVERVMKEEIPPKVVADCCRIKARIVEKDELDRTGRRAMLNYGHTVGHALELAARRSITHGEAVAVGMVVEADLAAELGVCAAGVPRRIESLVRRAGLPAGAARYRAGLADVMRRMQRDKKAVEGKLRFAVPTRIGDGRVEEVDDERAVRKLMQAALRRD